MTLNYPCNIWCITSHFQGFHNCIKCIHGAGKNSSTTHPSGVWIDEQQSYKHCQLNQKLQVDRNTLRMEYLDSEKALYDVKMTPSTVIWKITFGQYFIVP